MHPEAAEWVETQVSKLQRLSFPLHNVVDLGGRNVNGTSRHLFDPKVTKYTSVDIRPGEDVDIVASASDFGDSDTYDLVICTEVLEHTALAYDIVLNAERILKPGRPFIMTTAWTGRAPHSAVDGGALRPDPSLPNLMGSDRDRLEWYSNITEYDLVRWLSVFARWTIDTLDTSFDIRAIAWKRSLNQGR